MAKIKLNFKDYAQICLNCPLPNCEMDWFGQCDRTRPYQQPRAEEYAAREKDTEE